MDKSFLERFVGNAWDGLGWAVISVFILGIVALVLFLLWVFLTSTIGKAGIVALFCLWVICTITLSVQEGRTIHERSRKV